MDKLKLRLSTGKTIEVERGKLLYEVFNENYEK
jgi:hypothetical protein